MAVLQSHCCPIHTALEALFEPAKHKVAVAASTFLSPQLLCVGILRTLDSMGRPKHSLYSLNPENRVLRFLHLASHDG